MRYVILGRGWFTILVPLILGDSGAKNLSFLKKIEGWLMPSKVMTDAFYIFGKMLYFLWPYLLYHKFHEGL